MAGSSRFGVMEVEQDINKQLYPEAFYKDEYIICAAIWYEDLPTSKMLPVNIEKGIVICGHRHAHCISAVISMCGLRTVTYSEDGVGKNTQGFLTSKNRFLNRKEAGEIAFQSGQISEETNCLFSEDIY